MPKKIILTPEELNNPDGSFVEGGVEISIPGYKGNPVCPDQGQIWLEIFEGTLRVHIWGGSEVPNSIIIPKE